jgi:hypothetical protein
MSEQLESILSRVKAKGEFVMKANEYSRLANGNVREAYKSIIENELYAMMRLVDEYKTRVCNMICSMSDNIIMRGSLYPTEPIGPTGVANEVVEPRGESINYIR